MIQLDIPEAVPSLNRLLGIHWAKKHQERKKWAWLVRVAIVNGRAYPPEVPHKRVRVTFERFGPRIIDPDNFKGGCKFLTDSLVKEGFVEDDTLDHIEAHHEQHIAKERRTLVTIEALA